jgi:hypothetical protein
MDCGRDHFHLTAQSSYSIGERPNADVAPAALLNILRNGSYENEATIHRAFVDNSPASVRCRGQRNHVPKYRRAVLTHCAGDALSASPGCSCGRFNTPSETVKQGRRQEPCTKFSISRCAITITTPPS